MEITWPVIYEEFREARNPTSSATSSGLPNLPKGIADLYSFSSMSAVISVLINPGATVFTVTFFLATSRDKAFVAAIIPPFEAE